MLTIQAGQFLRSRVVFEFRKRLYWVCIGDCEIEVFGALRFLPVIISEVSNSVCMCVQLGVD